MDARLPDGLSVSHFSILNHLIRVKNEQTPLEIARAFQLPKTTMTHTLAGLESRGLIEMRLNPNDGRSKLVLLTDIGREFRDRAIADLVPDVAKLTRSISKEQISQLVLKLVEIRQVMDADRDEKT